MTWLVITAAAPLRAEPAHRSEMTSQLLFGELADELEQSGDFVKVKTRDDQYTGWCQKRQLAAFEEGLHTLPRAFTRNAADFVLVNQTRVMLSPGSLYFNLPGGAPVQVGPYRLSFQVHPPADVLSGKQGGELALEYARLFLGTPYLWGGRSLYGMDCSGLTQTACKLAGRALPRDSGPQSLEGEIVNLLQEARAGDLAFFDNEEGKITHVGLLLGPSEILHSSASVRIDPIDSYGIVHAETGERTHKLRTIRRVF